MTTTIHFWISNQADTSADRTALYFEDVARRSDLCDGIEVAEAEERGILLTGDADTLDLLGNQMDALLRHDRLGDDTRPVRFTWSALLMNPATGSVDTVANWRAEMTTWETSADGKTPQQQLAALIPVRLVDGSWVEA